MAAESGREDDGRVAQVIGAALGSSERLALSKTEAAERLGVSPDFFDRYIAPELHVVRRGRRQLYPLAGLIRWLEDASRERPDSGLRVTGTD